MKARALVAWNLRRIRVQRGVSQEQLAYDTGIDRAYVGGLERRAGNPTIDLLERLAVTLGVPVGELFAVPPKGATPPRTLPQGRKPAKSKRKKQ